MSAPKYFVAADGWVWRRAAHGWHTILPQTAEGLLVTLEGRRASELRNAINSITEPQNERKTA